MNVRDWFDNLNERERNLVYVAGALVGIALVYLVLVLPFQMSGKKMTARVGDSLVVLVDRTAREAGLGTSLRDQSPDGNNGLRLRIEGASFDALVTWLANLQQQYGVSIESATVGAAAPGLVNATLSLKQAGAAG
jgi:type II secretory pathway component PulM